MTHTPSLNVSPIRLRHIVRVGLPVTPDPLEMGVSGTDIEVLGSDFRASSGGLNGDRGFATGEYERRMWEEGDFRLRLANGPGDDGKLHRERFALTSLDLPDARAGDEWIEIYDGDPGRLAFVACPLDFELRRGTLELQGSDALWTLKKAHEFEAGFWCNAPRDVFEHYTRVWKARFADDFSTFTKVYDNDSTVDTHPDGRSQYVRVGTSGMPAGVANPPVGRVRLCTNAALGMAEWWTVETVDIGEGSADDNAAWRVEFRIWRSAFGTGTTVSMGLADVAEASGGLLLVAVFQMSESDTSHISHGMPGFDRDGVNTKKPGPFYVVIERRDRWVYFYLDGKLTAVAAAPEVLRPCNAYVRLDAGAAASEADAWVDIDSVVFRVAEPYLMRDTDKGDYHLGTSAADLPHGGLQAIYYDDHDLMAMTATQRPFHMLTPVKPPYKRKLEDTINFTAVQWQPVGPSGGNRWSVRFIGSIYLDLVANDIALGLNSSTAKRKRLWVGKTRQFEQVIDTWGTAASGRQSSGGLRAHLGTVTGWYPIVVEYSTDTGLSTFLLEQDVNVDGTWAVVPETQLSPFGVHLGHVRGESHADQLAAIAESFGLQYRCEPRQLESGFFPGHIPPKVRVGRDTEKIIDKIEADDYGKTGSIREVADTIFADGAGIADEDSGAQLTVEAIDYPLIEDRLFVQTEYDQTPEIDYEPLMARRLDVLLALRQNVWEEVGAVPKGAAELLDRFPLVDDHELFTWEPGDGVRLMIPEVGIMDANPRQILGVRRTFRPDGMLRPIVSFRPRPRGFLTLLRSLKLGAIRNKRTYQSQLVIVNSTQGAHNDPNYPSTVARMPWPVGGRIVKAWFVLLNLAGGTWNIEVPNGVTVITGITEAGRYDITPWAYQAADDLHQMSADVVATAGGTNAIRYVIEALVAY